MHTLPFRALYLSPHWWDGVVTLQEVQLARSFLFIHAKAFQGAERGGGAAKKKVNAAWGEGEQNRRARAC